jgi:hypothetical protein
MDDASARSYYQALVSDIIQEIRLMSEFRGNSNIVSFEDHRVIERKNEIGWDILIRMELLTGLNEFVMEKPLSPEDVIKLGIHICRALEICAVTNTIHRDIKPDNIFVSRFGEYKLGDFGIARQIERTMSGLSKKGTYTYMAPEVFTGQEYGANVDTYSLGIVMYRFLNQNRTPFLPAFPEPITPRDRDTALQRRMRGEAPPPLPGVAPALSVIVLKACAYDRKGRFGTPTEMRKALEALPDIESDAPMAASARVAEINRPSPLSPEGSVAPKRTDSAADSKTAAGGARVASGAFEPSTACSADDRPGGTEGVFAKRSAPRWDASRDADASRTEGVWDKAPPERRQRSLKEGIIRGAAGAVLITAAVLSAAIIGGFVLSTRSSLYMSPENAALVTTQPETNTPTPMPSPTEYTPENAALVPTRTEPVAQTLPMSTTGAVPENPALVPTSTEPVAPTLPADPTESTPEADIGGYITFGNYEWLVLDQRDDRILVISKDVIAKQVYNKEWRDVTWENCSLRQWLNQDFYGGFSADEQTQIIASHLSNPDNPYWKTKGGNDTEDKVFLLSIDEANQYFAGNEVRIAKYGDGRAWWWLRSPGRDGYAADVNSGGGVGGNGYRVVNTGGGVRPALWIQI